MNIKIDQQSQVNSAVLTRKILSWEIHKDQEVWSAAQRLRSLLCKGKWIKINLKLSNPVGLTDLSSHHG